MEGLPGMDENAEEDFAAKLFEEEIKEVVPAHLPLQLYLTPTVSLT